MAFTVTDVVRFKEALMGIEGSNTSNYVSGVSGPRTVVTTLTSVHYKVQKTAADALAATTSAPSVDVVPALTRVKSFKIMPGAALTADNTNYASLALKYDDGAGGAATTIATILTQITGSGNWTAGRTVSASSFTAVDVPANSRLFVDITKPGTGVVVPACDFIVDGELV